MVTLEKSPAGFGFSSSPIIITGNSYLPICAETLASGFQTGEKPGPPSPIASGDMAVEALASDGMIDWKHLKKRGYNGVEIVIFMIPLTQIYGFLSKICLAEWHWTESSDNSAARIYSSNPSFEKPTWGALFLL